MRAALSVDLLAGIKSSQLTGGQRISLVFTCTTVLMMSQVGKNCALRLRHLVGARFLDKKRILWSLNFVRVYPVGLIENHGLAFFGIVDGTGLLLTAALLFMRRRAELKVIASRLQDAAFLSL